MFRSQHGGGYVSLLVIAAGALAALLLVMNNVLKAALRRERVSFWDVLLAFMAALLPLAGLLVNATAEVPDPLADRAALVLALALLALSVLVMLLEAFRPQRLRGSRGLLGAFSGLLLLVSTFTVPFLSVYFALDETPAPVVALAPTVSMPGTAEPTGAAPTLSADQSARAQALFKAIRDVLREEIGADEVEVFRELDQGVPLARIIETHGGDLPRVVDRLSAILSQSLREAAERGEISRLQAALFISQMDAFVLLAVNTNLNELGARFSPGPTATGTRPSLMTLLTPPAETPTVEPTAFASEPPTTAPTRTASATPRPTETRVQASPTPSATRFQYSTRTPTPPPTAPAPCLATVNYNLRLRAAPSTESETLGVIPYSSSVALTGRSADSRWWQTTFEGQTGWVDGQYLAFSAGCDALPAS
jgi:hypothetical protein